VYWWRDDQWEQITGLDNQGKITIRDSAELGAAGGVIRAERGAGGVPGVPRGSYGCGAGQGRAGARAGAGEDQLPRGQRDAIKVAKERHEFPAAQSGS